jgi:hypothetical protein
LFLQTVVDTVMTATVLRGTTTEIVMATGIGTTEMIEIEIDMEVEDVVMTDVSPLERDIVAITGKMMTIRDVLIMKMTGVETIVALAKMEVRRGEAEAGVGAEEEEKVTGMV